LSDELDRRAAPLNAQVQATTLAPEWQNFVESNPRFAAMVEQMLASWSRMPEVTVSLFPALLALESLAALASPKVPCISEHASARHGAIADSGCGPAVWDSVGSCSWSSHPDCTARPAPTSRLFALYILRGLGVLAWFIAEKRLALAVLVLLALLFTPAVGVLALGIGLGDTWVDWRGRARQHLT
jgi:hypothetical protein